MKTKWKILPKSFLLEVKNNVTYSYLSDIKSVYRITWALCSTDDYMNNKNELRMKDKTSKTHVNILYINKLLYPSGLNLHTNFRKFN